MSARTPFLGIETTSDSAQDSATIPFSNAKLRRIPSEGCNLSGIFATIPHEAAVLPRQPRGWGIVANIRLKLNPGMQIEQ